VVGLTLAISGLSLDKASIALISLSRSVESSTPCHESCLIARSAWEQLIAARLPVSARLRRELNRVFTSGAASPTLKSELIKVSALGLGSDNPPEFVKDYLSSAKADPKVLAEIIADYPETADDNQTLFANLKQQASDSNISPATRREALKALAETGDASLTSFYFLCLNQDNDLGVRQEAVRAISTIKDQNLDYNVNQLAIIKNLIMAPDTDKALRADLVFLVGNYYPLFPSASAAILSDLYKQTPAGDNVSRALAADEFNRLGRGAKLAAPVVSQAEWDAYYNQ